MSSLFPVTLVSNRKFKSSFGEVGLSSDAVLLLIKEFADCIGSVKTLKLAFCTHNTAGFRFHRGRNDLLLLVFQIISAHIEDNCTDGLTNTPVITALLGKNIWPPN